MATTAKKKLTFSNVAAAPRIGSGLNVAPVTPVKPVTIAAPYTPPKYVGDGTFFTSLAQNWQQRDAQIKQLTTDSQRDQSDTGDSLNLLAKTTADSQSNTAAGAAKAGLGMSGYVAKTTTDQAAEGARQSTGIQEALRRRLDDRTNQITSLKDQYGDPSLTDPMNGAAQGTVGRSAYAAGEANFLANYTPPGATTAAVSPKSTNPLYPNVNAKGEAYAVKTINGKKVHVYTDGRKVVVG